MGKDEDRTDRPAIAPDNVRSHRAMIVSPALLEEIAWEWYRRGIASTGDGFHGESAVLAHPDMKRLIRAAFDRLYAKRRDS